MRDGRRPDIQVNIDATAMQQAGIGAGYIRSIVSDRVSSFLKRTEVEGSKPVQLIVRRLFNPNAVSSWFKSIVAIINQISLLTVILTGAAVIREREHGTLEHLLVMPLTPLQIMAAKVWANGLVVLATAALSLLLVVKGVLAVPLAGSLPLFLLGAMLHLFSTTSLGIALATVARSMPQFGLLMILVILPLQMLSGGMTPRESMPAVVQTLMLAAPTTHFVAFAQAILYRGAGLAVVWPHCLAIAAIGVTFFLIALARFRRAVALAQS
jgi:ABC-2 type transport system permease protein